GDPIDNDDIFVLVDEGHRTQFGTMNARMEQKLPKACMFAFTGTPVTTRIKKETKSTVRDFGGIADTYTIREANEDKAVVPLTYEGREVPLEVDRKRLDSWLDRKTSALSDKQKADLKQKFARKSMLTSAEQRIAMIAYDVASHFTSRFRGTGFKGQLVAPDKASAIRYAQHLQEAGIAAEVLISPPDDREGEEGELAKKSESKQEVRDFWKRMMDRFGDPDAYQDKLIETFSAGGDPEILVVVSKLLVGFDAPRNSVLYLARRLKDHTLLQAIARVNRLHDDKDEGLVVDYEGVIKDLDTAIADYAKRAKLGDDFDEKTLEQLKGIVESITEVLKRLPNLRDDLSRFFPGLEDRNDLESYERKLDDPARREDFYETLTEFTRVFGRAMSTVSFLEETSDSDIKRYKADLKFFQVLRSRLKHRHQEIVAFGEYEAEVKHLIDQHVGADEVELVVPEIPLFDDRAREEELKRLGSDSSKADAMAANMQRTISENWDQNPAFFRKFSDMLTQIIDEWRSDRLKEKEYLAKVRSALEQLKNEGAESGPAELENEDAARAYFGIVETVLGEADGDGDFRIDAAKTIDTALADPPVDWTNSKDYKNRVALEIDEQLFDLSNDREVPLTGEQIDSIIEQCISVAEKRAEYKK
ncbi:MAG: type I restriction enzyme endonuclease domain-containing protein, partial [Planctomycetota bacterium]